MSSSEYLILRLLKNVLAKQLLDRFHIVSPSVSSTEEKIFTWAF